MSKKKGTLNQRSKRDIDNVDLLQKFTFTEEIVKNPSRAQASKDIYQIIEKPKMEQEQNDREDAESESEMLQNNESSATNNLSKINVSHSVPDRF